MKRTTYDGGSANKGTVYKVAADQKRALLEHIVTSRNLWQVLAQEATIHGFLIMGYAARFAEAGAVMADWMAEGRLRIDEDVQHGLENAYPAFMRLFTGANTGKLVLQIA